MEEPIVEETGKNNGQAKIEELKVRDYMDMVSELTGLIRENYTTNFQLPLSVHGENGAGLKRSGQRSESNNFLNQLNIGGKDE
jgi:hypothetical protein